jgi:hypothetical protein
MSYRQISILKTHQLFMPPAAPIAAHIALFPQYLYLKAQTPPTKTAKKKNLRHMHPQ